mmetsp:Transcript_19617/g.38985  ORF Transcript_19617/g.38985 Transcript_19617/m.38985 type:complete len:355 (+) Transcript_19617:548-1612(+)
MFATGELKRTKSGGPRTTKCFENASRTNAVPYERVNKIHEPHLPHHLPSFGTVPSLVLHQLVHRPGHHGGACLVPRKHKRLHLVPNLFHDVCRQTLGAPVGPLVCLQDAVEDIFSPLPTGPAPPLVPPPRNESADVSVQPPHGSQVPPVLRRPHHRRAVGRPHPPVGLVYDGQVHGGERPVGFVRVESEKGVRNDLERQVPERPGHFYHRRRSGGRGGVEEDAHPTDHPQGNFGDIVQDVVFERGPDGGALPHPLLSLRRHDAPSQDGQEGRVREIHVLLYHLHARLEGILQQRWGGHGDALAAEQDEPVDRAVRGVPTRHEVPRGEAGQGEVQDAPQKREGGEAQRRGGGNGG